ncbi:MAG: hypothetical protein PVH65_16600 [Chloroflexota bacterium]|jgi:hypothetical protein
MNKRMLLLADAAINLALGLPLLFVPKGTAALLGIPVPEVGFYASILGAVLTGIGLALLVEYYHGRFKVTGLGLGGAVAINLCGGGALAIWLLNGALVLPTRGNVFLWIVAVAVLGISLVEAAHLLARQRR